MRYSQHSMPLRCGEATEAPTGQRPGAPCALHPASSVLLLRCCAVALHGASHLFSCTEGGKRLVRPLTCEGALSCLARSLLVSQIPDDYRQTSTGKPFLPRGWRRPPCSSFCIDVPLLFPPDWPPPWFSLMWQAHCSSCSSSSPTGRGLAGGPLPVRTATAAGDTTQHQTPVTQRTTY